MNFRYTVYSFASLQISKSQKLLVNFYNGKIKPNK